MNEQEYRNAVAQLMNPELTFNERLGNFALGLVCETGELAEKLQNGYELNAILDECSDQFWYFTASSIMLDFESYEKKFNQLISEGDITYRKSDITTLFIKASKFGDLIKKVIYHQHPLLEEKIRLVNLLWCFYEEYRQFISMWGFTMAQIRQYNFNKLSKRYKNLSFSPEQSLHRID